MSNSIGVLYVGDVLHRALLRCDAFSHDCLRRVVRADCRAVVSNGAHNGIALYATFRRMHEGIVRDEFLRPVIGHLICNIGGCLFFHEDGEEEWLSGTFRQIGCEAATSALLVVCSSQSQLREALACAGPWFQPAPEATQTEPRGTPRRWSCLLIANGRGRPDAPRCADT
ncbi:MAG: hypothetical protein M5R41_17925 [Bacteroidia bacterium]|nr:hypothetical protein [Bacteroidia bacterium]